MNKFNPRTAFVIILILIFGVGLFLLLKTPKPANDGTTPGDKGFLSFFGSRKLKTVDETTVPGANSNNKYNPDGTLNPNYDPTKDATDNVGTGGTGSGGTGTGGNGTGSNGNGTGGTGANGTGSGSLSIKSIGTNTGGGGQGGNGGDQGVGGGGNPGGGSGPGTGGGVGPGGGGVGPNNPTNPDGSVNPNYDPRYDVNWRYICPVDNPNCNVVQPIETVDCTPPKLPYTQAEIDQLKVLLARFYNIASGLKTQSDIQNERDTRASYIDLINQAADYTKACIAQVKEEKAKPTGKSLDNNPRWNPYLSASFVKKLPENDQAISDFTSQIKFLTENIELYNAQIEFLKSKGTLNDSQKVLLTKTLPYELSKAEDTLSKIKQSLADLQNPKKRSVKLLKGTFFPELGLKKVGDKYLRIYTRADYDNVIQNTKANNYYPTRGVIYKDFMTDNMNPKRLNDDWDRRARIFFMIENYIWDHSTFYTGTAVRDTDGDGNNDQYIPETIAAYFNDAPMFSNNPLKWMYSDRPNHLLDDPNHECMTSFPYTCGLKNFHRLQQLEDALGIW